MTKGINFVVSDIRLTTELVDKTLIKDAIAAYNAGNNSTIVDQRALRTFTTNYVNENRFTYNLCMYTWEQFWIKFIENGSAIFVGLIKERGLLSLIKVCDTIASKIQSDIDSGEILDLFSDESYMLMLLSLFDEEYEHATIRLLANGLLRSKVLNSTLLLQLLKYPKRMCIKNKYLEAASIKDFIATEKRNRNLDRKMTPTWLILRMRDLAYDLFGDFDYISPDCGELVNVGLPTGSTYFGMLTRMEKWALVYDEYPELLYPHNVIRQVSLSFKPRFLRACIKPRNLKIMPVTPNGRGLQFSKTPIVKWSTGVRIIDEPRYGVVTGPTFKMLHAYSTELTRPESMKPHIFQLEHRAARVTAVPKSYKAARIIAMEHPINYMRQKHLANYIDRFFRKPRFFGSLDIHSQQRSVDMCRDAAIGAHLVTVDHSHASDTVRKSVICDILPHRMAKAIMDVVPDYINVDGELMPLSMAATSGCACTFVTEMVIFYLTARLAVEIAGGDDNDIASIAVYGDDVIIPSFALETYIEIASRLGLEINVAKSFAGDDRLRYREACGAEFISDALTGDVYDGKCVYYPRRFLSGSVSTPYSENFDGTTNDDLTSLVSLQHHLYNICIGAADIVGNVITQLYPRMTSSPVGTLSSDMWDIVPHYTSVKAPYKNVIAITDSNTGEISEKPYEPNNGVADREVHSIAVVNYKTRDLDKEYLDLLVDGRPLTLTEFKFRQFLLLGPEYDDGLMKLLKVSKDRPVHLYDRIDRKSVV